MKAFKNWKPMIRRKTSQSGNTTPRYYGKPITLDIAKERTHELVDYYEALKNGRTLPKKPHRALGYLLRCNAIVNLHYTETNMGLQGMAFKNWALTQEQVIYTWLFAYKMNSDKPLITLNGVQLNFIKP